MALVRLLGTDFEGICVDCLLTVTFLVGALGMLALRLNYFTVGFALSRGSLLLLARWGSFRPADGKLLL